MWKGSSLSLKNELWHNPLIEGQNRHRITFSTIQEYLPDR